MSDPTPPQGKIVTAVRPLSIEDASIGAEQTLNLLALADKAASQGDAEQALCLLESFAAWDKSDIHQVLINQRKDFAAVGITYYREPVPAHAQRVYDSVHKLLMMLWPEMAARLQDSAWDMPEHLLEHLGLDPLAELHVGLQRERERLRLLRPSPPPPAPPRLTVDLARKTITLDGIAHDVDSENVLRWVKVLADHPGEWISGPDLKKYDPALLAPRTDRWHKKLPAPVRPLIESDTGKGSRLKIC
jgi:hypothetical protein